MTTEELAALIEAEERIAIQQEGSGAEIDIVPRDTTTGELLPRKNMEVRR
jgi:hypothetical protein